MCQFNLLERIQTIESNNKKVAYFYVMVGHFFMVAQWSVFKYLMNQQLDSNQILYLRGVIVFLFNLYIISRFKHKVYPDNEGAQKILYIRFAIQMVSPLFQFYGIQQLIMSDATVLSLTGPIWVQISSLLIFKEKLQHKNLTYTLISFIGIIFICRPAFIFKNEAVGDSSENRVIGSVCMLIGSITLAVSQTLMKGLKGKTSNVVAMQYFYFSNIISTPVLMIYKETNDVRVYFDIYLIMILLFVSVIAYLGQLTLSRGLILESPAKLSQLAYTRIIYAFVVDLFIFHQSIGLLSFIGFLLIVCSSIQIVTKR